MNQDLSKLGWVAVGEGGENTENGGQIVNSLRSDFPDSSDASGETPSPMFDITTTKPWIVENDTPDKTYILYTIRVCHGSARADLHTTTIDRRYTEFLQLYEGLRKDCPDLLESYTFPRKALLGNFSQKLINERTQKFEALLELVTKQSRLRNSVALLHFLQDKELKQALDFCGQKRYDLAEPIFKHSFRLLNKVYTDRSPAVLLALCRLVGCYACTPGILSESVERWATLALHRYEGVSDCDMLILYGPLLETCLKLWERKGKDWQLVRDRLADMKRRGICMQRKSLLDAVDDVDKQFRQLQITNS